jgi:2'-5' RNA ligase
MFRGFISIGITAFPKIIEFENAILNTKVNVKLVSPNNIHITLKFLGNVDEELVEPIQHAISESAQGVTPFSITLRGTGVFPNPNYIKVIWIGIENAEPLMHIASILEGKLEDLGFQKERRSFSAHLTIGRVRTAKNKQQLIQAIGRYDQEEFGVEQVTNINLMKSELTPKGPIYSILREIPL